MSEFKAYEDAFAAGLLRAAEIVDAWILTGKKMFPPGFVPEKPPREWMQSELELLREAIRTEARL